jgi:hypothetical protein
MDQNRQLDLVLGNWKRKHAPVRNLARPKSPSGHFSPFGVYSIVPND